MEEKALEVVKDITKEIATDVYQDVGHPVAQPTGELLGLVPRAVKAALEPLEKWILQKEYNVAETKKLLEKKLENVSPELIESPEPYIAVPAVQYISYCMDNEELRNMYANLLANSMTKVIKNGVHPGYVEIIKQLSPDEAKILKYLNVYRTVPTISLRVENEKGEGVDKITNFSNVGELTDCEMPMDISKYFDNLMRLGLVESGGEYSSLVNKEQYKPLKEHPYIEEMGKIFSKLYPTYSKVNKKEGYVFLTNYGAAFCEICLDKNVVHVVKGE